MQTWFAIKALIAQWSGLDRDALHLVGSIVAILLAALVTRRPLSSTRPWVLLFALCVGEDIASAWAGGTIRDGRIELAWRDIALVMALPTVLFLLTRYFPALTAPEQRPVRILLPLPPDRWLRQRDIVDAEFEDVIEPARD